MTVLESALVTGATGFIGSHLVRRLVENGVTTYCLTRGVPQSSRSLWQLRGAKVVKLPSISAREIAASLQGISAQVVFHLASPDILEGKQHPAGMVDVNVNFVTRLLAAISDWPLKSFIYTGTFSEYGPMPHGKLSEDTPLLPASVYGASKAAAFLCGRGIAEQLQIPFVNLRLFGVYGPGEAERRLVPYLIQRLSLRQPAELTAGTQVRDLLYVDDVVDALCTAASATPALKHSVYNVCSGVPVTVRAIAELIAKQLKVPEQLLRFGARPHRSDNFQRIVGDNKRFTEATSWTPRWNLSTGVEDTIRQFVQLGTIRHRAA